MDPLIYLILPEEVVEKNKINNPAPDKIKISQIGGSVASAYLAVESEPVGPELYRCSALPRIKEGVEVSKYVSCHRNLPKCEDTSWELPNRERYVSSLFCQIAVDVARDRSLRGLKSIKRYRWGAREKLVSEWKFYYEDAPRNLEFKVYLIQSDKLYEGVTKVLSYMYDHIHESEGTFTFEVTRELKKGADELVSVAKLATDLAIDILSTPDKTDKILPNLDFPLQACLYIFDPPLCFSHVITQINKLYLEDKELREKFVSPKQGKIGIDWPSIAKLKDSICIVAHTDPVLKTGKLYCLINSNPETNPLPL